MKFNTKIILTSVILLSAVLIAIWKFSPGNTPGDRRAQEALSSSKRERVNDKNNGDKLGTKTSDAGKIKPSDKAQEGKQPVSKLVILEKMHAAAVTYDAASLPVIKPYLVNPDPEIRKEAVNAMLILGDSAASPLLREAAKLMTTAEDMKTMIEAAEFLELPPIDPKKIFRKKKGAETPEPPVK
jgi:hypothetical protein